MYPKRVGEELRSSKEKTPFGKRGELLTGIKKAIFTKSQNAPS
jgi:hypothetical protein